MRTLSARILLGFAALTIAFAVITGTVVRNMAVLEDNMVIIGTGWVPLALASKDLSRKQEELKTYIESQFQDETNPVVAKNRLLGNWKRRTEAIKAAIDVLDKLNVQIEVDPQQFQKDRSQLETLLTNATTAKTQYDLVVASPPLGDPAKFDPKKLDALATLQILRSQEKQTLVTTNNLDNRLDTYVTKINDKLTKNGRTVRVRTIYLGIVAVVFGFLLMVWVVIALRPLVRLRAAARRIAAGDYASKIPEKGPTEVADLAREFNSMSTAVEERQHELVRSERLAAVGKMAAMITHEVRNPLSSIGLNTELLEEELEGSPNEVEARGLCRAINHEVDRLTAITEEYLSFARLPKPKIAAEPVNGMVDALARFIRQDLASKKVSLVTALSDDDPVAAVDAAQLRQCLINLVRNAGEAVAAKGGGTITLRTRSIEGDRVSIEVEDDGIGIPPDVLPRLFDPFFSTKEGGSGLGLALTKQIVKDHGGDLDVASTVGKGTTFTVRVPASKQGLVAIAP